MCNEFFLKPIHSTGSIVSRFRGNLQIGGQIGRMSSYEHIEQRF